MPYLFTTAEYADMVFIYGLCDGNATAAALEYQRRYPDRRIPNPKTISGTFLTLRETGSLPSTNTRLREHAVRHDVAIAENIINAVHRSPGVSTRRLSQRFEVTQSMVWRTLKNNNLYPYHKQNVHTLLPQDAPLRLEFCRWLNRNRRLYRRILFTDEAQFTRDGVNNFKNEHIWAEENPHQTVETNSQHRFSANVWCGVINNKLVGPFILPERLNSEVYLRFLQEELPNLLEDVPLALRRGMYFQHDGAPPHFSLAVRAHLDFYFPERWIGRGGPHSWPPRSPDLTPVDYCIWGWMKNIVYKTKVNTREELIGRIMGAAAELKDSSAKLRRATYAVHKRADKCIEMEGQIFENLL